MLKRLPRSSIGNVVWAVVGIALWSFLLSPYVARTVNCWDANTEGEMVSCLKPIARDLRSDSNLATYATATVAAAIALQLSNRSRESNSTRE